MPIRAKALSIKENSISTAKSMSDETLHLTVQNWMDEENQGRGYLIGLSPCCNVTKLTDIQKQCESCTGSLGNCYLSDIVRNLASSEIILKMIVDKEAKRKEEALTLVEERYPTYAILKEYVTRNCKGQWLTF